jgi:hypothetical protein
MMMTELEETFTLLNVCVVKVINPEPNHPVFIPLPVLTFTDVGATL